MPTVPLPQPPSSPTTTSGIAESTDGSRVIPASTRPNGTTRKEIRVRPGYRPPEDVELYKNRNAVALQSRGKEWKDGVPGAVMVSDDEGTGTAASIKNARKKAAKKRAKENAAAAAATAAEVKVEEEEKKKKKVEQQPSLTSAKTKAAVESLTEEEKEKQAKAIKKKIRQATDLKAKKENGESLLPEQLEKVTRILELTRQLEALGVKE
ncbi:hypothetical protein L211DRAFT_841920 [Terfezia boudieri ATCC MYA-4762]|uniref:WIBG Mago-binding domain-containing protein n=1 Tax=Terfezia boudieri ATCC MYA-4762 TaxID=1051890 RepID=A0A3N4LFH6_9PEZI|nr:hypothetical protein L211DRAFT_841920 [Terfezia boudieri ATCC MYA-4762]